MRRYSLPQQQEQVRRIIGRVSVDAAFYKKLSARENLLYTALLYGQKARDAERRAMDILEQLGMENSKFSHPLEEMSRGMQQKISIARALVLNPPILLLDEPTTGLDPKSRRDVQTFLEKLKEREGTTILLTTHDMAEAERLCARIGFLAHGKLVAEGTAARVNQRAQTKTLDDAFINLTGEELSDKELVAVERVENGNNNAANVGLYFSRLPPDPPLHWLGNRLQLLCARHVCDCGTDRRSGRKLSVDTYTRGGRVAMELSVVAVPGDCDVDRL